MIKVNDIEVYNVLRAIKGLRNPLESWDKMDSYKDKDKVVIGNNDLGLMRRLFKAGKDHRKFTRQILVSFDLTAPDYFFREFDTYKVGTTANSTSQMHKIMSKPFTEELFSCENIVISKDGDEHHKYSNHYKAFKHLLNSMNELREEWLKTKDPQIWKTLVQMCPQSWNYTRHITLNYEVLYNMYYSRKNHKLTEWREFCKILEEQLPYFKAIAEIE